MRELHWQRFSMQNTQKPLFFCTSHFLYECNMLIHGKLKTWLVSKREIYPILKKSPFHATQIYFQSNNVMDGLFCRVSSFNRFSCQITWRICFENVKVPLNWEIFLLVEISWKRALIIFIFFYFWEVVMFSIILSFRIVILNKLIFIPHQIWKSAEYSNKDIFQKWFSNKYWSICRTEAAITFHIRCKGSETKLYRINVRRLQMTLMYNFH